MPLSPEEERRVKELLEQAAAEGRRVGERDSLRRVIAARARQILRADYRGAEEVLRRFETLGGALYNLARLFLSGSVARWCQRLRPVINDVAEAATEPASEILGPFDARRTAMNEFLESYVSELADRLAETTYSQVMDVIREAQEEGLGVPEAARRLREKAGIEGPRRAKLIARNELQRTSKGARWTQALESGVVSGKKRNEQMDSRTRPEHRPLHGEERAIDEPYSNGEMWAGEIDINCRGWDEFLLDHGALEARGTEPPQVDEELPEPEEWEDPHDAVRRVFEGEDLTDEEAETLARRIAERAGRRGFDVANRERAGDISGMVYEGDVLTRRTLLRPDVRHWLKHVVKRREWPDGTDVDGYKRTVREVIEDPETYVVLNVFEGREQVSFVRRSGNLKGPKGYEWVLVEYVLTTGHVRTAFQPEDGLEWVTDNSEREIVRWLRGPR